METPRKLDWKCNPSNNKGKAMVMKYFYESACVSVSLSTVNKIVVETLLHNAYM